MLLPEQLPGDPELARLGLAGHRQRRQDPMVVAGVTYELNID
jgi:hypothetical protein